jgi:hypothetical protein
MLHVAGYLYRGLMQSCPGAREVRRVALQEEEVYRFCGSELQVWLQAVHT